ncbi:MAG: peptide chain release factor 1 [Acidobacteria bacterium]|nr:peptide chain release factor 1 [Acidobacteriota bacterium]MCG2816937.1 peptide chain release factor 1 [Candidatus Aminicenantes bacterium]MBU1337945.1 peptide chain release factor 1 [Acidobacteriota bacterium]MBU1475038.1 peptide chain release factor 1 [Acidobacteriota bacterium]MBU4330651.1 peptide chain release factor 1 [Acidobacteriota bacterium]
MLDELEDLKKRYASLLTSLSDPGIASDPHKLRTVSKERSDLEPIVSKYEEYLHLKKELRDSRELLNDPNTEAELRDLADQECKGLEDRLEAVEEGLKYLLLPKDPNDEKNVFLEIRAGAGGDEASLFAQDLFRMYTRFAETVGWRFEVMSSSYSPVGGLKEIIVNIKGKRVFSRLKYESGVHRVQRVPQTEASGRIHTSTVTVAVLPEADEVDIRLDPKDLRIEAFGASGPGGQSVNRNYTAIRITHRPSGMVVSCQDEKSQHRNKERALRVLRSRLLDIVQSEQQQEIADNRKSQVGTGKRSEKIRTYNFPQSRVTDHRLNLSLHKLEAVLDGDLEDFLDALTVHNQTEMIGRVSSGLEN